MYHANLRIISYIYNVTSVVIIGGGAAGCFCAAELSRLCPEVGITVLEAHGHPMAKLAVTGGGRCNLTNTFQGVTSLSEVYPRGDKFMRKVLGRFGWQDTCRWFEENGVRLTAQPDHCIFPVSQDAMQIVRTLERLMREGGVTVRCGCKVESIGPDLQIVTASGEVMRPSAVVLTSGGGTSGILEGTGIELVPDVPSLYTLKIEDKGLRSLMGTVVENTSLGIAGTNFRSSGTLLLTDWGVSGPATLRLSSYAARHLAENGFQGTLLIGWLGREEEPVRNIIRAMACSSAKMVANTHPPQLSDRLWRFLVARAGIREDARWGEIGAKSVSRLAGVLTADTYPISGRARWKEEFVTCGGVALSGVKPETMESRVVKSLHFAGEVLDIDAVTGGFNLQAAWSTAYIAANAIATSSRTFKEY